MYVMKLLIAADTAAVDHLIAIRMEFQLRKRVRQNGEGRELRDVACTPTRPDDGRMAIGMWDDGKLVAAVVLQDAAPQHGWTIEEREQPTLLVGHALSLPGQAILGRLVTLWLSDYAARQHHQPLVRCAVRDRALAWRLVRSCGWERVREVSDLHSTLHLMQRYPERFERLGVVVSSTDVPDLDRQCHEPAQPAGNAR